MHRSALVASLAVVVVTMVLFQVAVARPPSASYQPVVGDSLVFQNMPEQLEAKFRLGDAEGADEAAAAEEYLIRQQLQQQKSKRKTCFFKLCDIYAG